MYRACAVGRPPYGVSSGIRLVRLRFFRSRLRRDEYLIVVRQDAVFTLSLFRYARLGWVWSDARGGCAVPWPCLWVFFSSRANVASTGNLPLAERWAAVADWFVFVLSVGRV